MVMYVSTYTTHNTSLLNTYSVLGKNNLFFKNDKLYKTSKKLHLGM